MKTFKTIVALSLVFSISACTKHKACTVQTGDGLCADKAENTAE